MGVDPSQLLPGRTDIKQEQLNTPPSLYISGPFVNTAEQRWQSICAANGYMSDEMKAFMYGDVPRLLALAKAAYALNTANNAEKYRQAMQTLTALTQ